MRDVRAINNAVTTDHDHVRWLREFHLMLRSYVCIQGERGGESLEDVLTTDSTQYYNSSLLQSK